MTRSAVAFVVIALAVTGFAVWRMVPASISPPKRLPISGIVADVLEDGSLVIDTRNSSHQVRLLNRIETLPIDMAKEDYVGKQAYAIVLLKSGEKEIPKNFASDEVSVEGRYLTDPESRVIERQ